MHPANEPGGEITSRLCRACPFRALRVPVFLVAPDASSASLAPSALPRNGCPEPWAVLAKQGVTAAARSVGCSERTLRRRFRLRGTSPGEVARLIRASWLLRLLVSGTPVAEAAIRLGMSSAAALTRFSLAVLGERPAVLRRLLVRCAELCGSGDERGLTTFGQALDDAETPSPD